MKSRYENGYTKLGSEHMNIKELAKEIGVSSATISRVVNNSGYVSEKTRAKVLDAIDKYQYVPNAIARSLSTKSSKSIGVIVPDIENEYFSAVISGISNAAEGTGYSIHFMGTNENIESEHAFLETVGQQRLDGVIITPVSEYDTYTKEKLLKMRENKVPVVLVDRSLQGANLEGVFVDNFAGAYDGVKALIEAGHTKIAIITGVETSRPGKERHRGYLEAMKDANIPVNPKYVLSGDFKIDKAYECTKKLLTMEDPPTAIFTSNNKTTLGCLKYMTENKIKLGKDLSVLGFDDIEVLNIIRYKLSVVSRDAKLQGYKAMELLLKEMESNEIPKNPVSICIPYEVILRGSEKSKKLSTL